MDLNKANIFGGAAIIGLVTGFWEYIKLYATKILSLFVVRILLDRKTTNAMSMLLNKHFTCSHIGKKNYRSKQEYVRPIKRNQVVSYEVVPQEATIWWRGIRPLIVSGDVPWSMNILFIRGTFKRDDLIIEAVEEFNKQNNDINYEDGDRFCIIKKYGSIGVNKTYQKSQSTDSKSSQAPRPSRYDDEEENDINKYTSRPIQWKREDIGQPKNKEAIDKLSLSSDALEAVKESLHWRANEYWFKERSIPWKRGFLLTGNPGTGKTAFTRALGQELNMPIFSFDLASMTNKDLSVAWSELMSSTPCIALFEDIDSIFDGRKNIAVKGLENGLTFDGFLNCLDGVENTDGVFIIITTNNSKAIDPAICSVTHGDTMSSRPGRIDRCITFNILDRDGRIKMAKRIMEHIPEDQWYFLIDKYDNDTGAQFQERCCKLALEIFWRNKGEI